MLHECILSTYNSIIENGFKGEDYFTYLKVSIKTELFYIAKTNKKKQELTEVIANQPPKEPLKRCLKKYQLPEDSEVMYIKPSLVNVYNEEEQEEDTLQLYIRMAKAYKEIEESINSKFHPTKVSLFRFNYMLDYSYRELSQMTGFSVDQVSHAVKSVRDFIKENHKSQYRLVFKTRTRNKKRK